MRRLSLILCLALLFGALIPVYAQKGGTASNGSVEVTCPDGTPVLNGIEVIVNMRPGFTYTATAVGINGYDPIIAVSDQNGIGLCTDDDPKAGSYSLSLPTTGDVRSSKANSQVPFFHNFSGFADISLIVGSPTGETGEFVLVLEGMAVTTNDGSGAGAGDPYSVRITQNMVNSGVPLTAYMISVTDALDTFMQLVDSDRNVLFDDNNDPVQCDDAGDSSYCWGDSSSMSNSFISRTNGRQLPGGPYDSMISLGLNGIDLDPDPDLNFLRFLMSSSQQNTFGDYMVAFHIGTGDPNASGNNGNQGQTQIPTPSGTKPQQGGIPTPSTTKPQQGETLAGGGVDVTCPDGTPITNAVEIVVSMRPGFTYTATALGINGFDPIMAVSDQNGVGLCEDDESNAITYTADLPTTGFIANETTNSQVPFFHNFSGFADISIIVGGVNGSSGEFVLVLEGMAVTTNDGSGVGAGDPFSVRITPNMVNSGVPLATYMISVTDALDPFIQLVDSDRNVITDGNNDPIQCDDAGDASLCWGESDNLSRSFISRTRSRQLPGGPYDAMLNLSLSGLTLDPDSDNNFLKFLMSSSQQSTFGDYLVAFHMGIAAASGGKPNV